MRTTSSAFARSHPRPVLLALLAGLALTAAGCPTGGDHVPDQPPPGDPIPYITDDAGGVRIFHGLNVMSASKGAADRMPPIDEAVVHRMAEDWEFNLARFLIFWDHVEPEPGVIGDAYLGDVETRLDWFAAAGIDVILDMHQDVYAQRFCCDGAPEWAIRDDGQPFELQSTWFLNYFQPAVQRSFDNFFAYTDGEHADLQDHYADAWAAVATRLGDHPAVLGYDLMNEPHPGSAVDLAELLGTHNPDGTHPAFDRERLWPFFQRVIDRIREVDDERWLFVETRYGAPGNGLPSYQDAALVDPRDGHPRIAYFPHLYSLQLESTGAYDADTDPAIPGFEQHRVAEAAEYGYPLLIGEWGFDTTWDHAHDALNDTLAMADRATSGWAYWSLDPGSWGLVDADWNERDAADLLVRPYPRRVAGLPVSYGYDPATRVFHLELTDRDGVTGSTEISLPASRHYPGGWELTVSDPEGHWSSTWDAEQELLSVTLDPADGGHRIEIRPAG